MIGKTLGHYQITNQIGKGGMGEVYQAKDQVLGREVAIKVLPEEFARDTNRVARFQCKAKVLASLNHSNIAAIHGLEQSEGKNFLVLELVEGQTLADQMKIGPIPHPNIAAVYIGRGNKSQAFDYLQRAFDDHSFWLIFMRADPRFDSIRSDPRYQDLLRRMHLIL